MTWPTKTLGEVATWGSGGTPKRSESQYFGEGIPWLSIADLNDGVVTEAKESLTTVGLQNCTAKVVPAGTLLVAMYGSIGKLGIAGVELCTSQAIAFARPDPRLVDTRYLFHYLLAQRPRLQGHGRGGTQMNIGQGDLKAWPIPLPPLDEQHRIATILEQAEAIRAKRREALTGLDALVQAHLSVLLSNEATVPRELGKVATFFAGGSLPAGEEFTSQQGGHLLMKVSDMNRPGNEREIIETALWSHSPGARSATCPPGSIIIPKRGGAIGTNKKRISTRPTVLDPNLMAVLPGPEINLTYLFTWFLRFDLATISSGSSVPQLNKQDLSPLAIPVPPVPLQRDFAKVAERVARLASTYRRQVDAMTDSISALQSRAFTGQL